MYSISLFWTLCTCGVAGHSHFGFEDVQSSLNPDCVDTAWAASQAQQQHRQACNYISTLKVWAVLSMQQHGSCCCCWGIQDCLAGRTGFSEALHQPATHPSAGTPHSACPLQHAPAPKSLYPALNPPHAPVPVSLCRSESPAVCLSPNSGGLCPLPSCCCQQCAAAVWIAHGHFVLYTRAELLDGCQSSAARLTSCNGDHPARRRACRQEGHC